MIQKQQVAVQRKATISLSDLIQKMQHQMQRSMLFNVALFSGADFSERASARAIRLQLSLLGFHVSLNEASLLLDRFSEDAAGLHFALVARKLQTACYTSMDDTVKCAIQAADPDNTGFCPAHYFELIVRRVRVAHNLGVQRHDAAVSHQWGCDKHSISGCVLRRW